MCVGVCGYTWTYTDKPTLTYHNLNVNHTGDPAAEEALRAAQRHMKAAAPAAWTDRITSDKWYASMEKKGPHAPGQPLAVRVFVLVWCGVRVNLDV